MNTAYTRIGVTVSCYPSIEMPGLLEHKVGYEMSRDENGNLALRRQQKFDPLAAGIHPGMSGGGLIKDEKLVGLPVRGAINGGGSHVLGGLNLFVPLSNHKVWLEETIAEARKIAGFRS